MELRPISRKTKLRRLPLATLEVGGSPTAGRVRLTAMVVVLAILPYLNGLGGDFTFDDEAKIIANPVVHATALPLGTLLTTPCEPQAHYRPLPVFTYWLNQRWAPGGSVGFHAVNVALHAVVAALVLQLALVLLPSASAAFCAALLFAVHPVHTEAVTSIVGRSELLAAAGILAALLCALRSRRSPGTGWVAASVGCYALALLSKENAPVLLPMLVATIVAFEDGALAAAARACRSREVVALGVATLAYAVLRLVIFGALTSPSPTSVVDNPLAHAALAPRLATAAVVAAEYVGLLLAPLRLSADYSFNQVPLVDSLGDVRLWAAVLLFGALAAALLRLRRRVPGVVVGAVLFVAALALTANVLFPIGTIKAERLLYLPSAGACVAAGAIAQAMARRRTQAVAAWVAVVVLAFATRTWVRNWDWQSNGTLFTAAVATAPHSAKAHHNYAVTLDQRGAYDEAAVAFRQALHIYPDYAEAAFGIGRMYEQRNVAAGALHWYDEALRLDPALVPALINRGALRYRRGDYVGAEGDFRAGLQQAPDNPALLTGLGMSRLAGGDTAAAAALLKRAAQLEPQNVDVRRGLQLALRSRGETDGPQL